MNHFTPNLLGTEICESKLMSDANAVSVTNSVKTLDNQINEQTNKRRLNERMNK